MLPLKLFTGVAFDPPSVTKTTFLTKNLRIPEATPKTSKFNPQNTPNLGLELLTRLLAPNPRIWTGQLGWILRSAGVGKGVGGGLRPHPATKKSMPRDAAEQPKYHAAFGAPALRSHLGADFLIGRHSLAPKSPSQIFADARVSREYPVPKSPKAPFYSKFMLLHAPTVNLYVNNV